MRRSIFLLGCSIIGIVALVALWPSRVKTNPTPSSLPPVNAPTIASTPTIFPTDPVRGEPKAPLTIIEFSDFTCPHCADVELILAELRRQYGARLKIIWKDLPILDRITGSRQLHIAARCAQRQGKFWEYHDALFQSTPADDAVLLTLANTLGLDAMGFTTCMTSTIAASAVAMGEREAYDLGITSTPTLFVNDAQYTGDLTTTALGRALEEQLPR